MGPIKSNKRVKIKEGGKTPWNSIYVTENCESEIVLAKRSFRREIKSGKVEGDIVVVEELPADGFRELKDGGGRLLFENQNKLIPVEDFFFRLRCNWDQLCRNLFAMAGDQLDSVFICSVSGFVTTSRVNFCKLCKFWQNYTLLEQKGVISSIIDEIIKLRKT